MRSHLASLFVLLALAAAAFSTEPVQPANRARTSKASPLNAHSASQLAASLANRASKRQFGVAPFSASRATPQLVRGRWHWQATAGYGKTDLVASVSFSHNGSSPTASISQLVLPEWE